MIVEVMLNGIALGMVYALVAVGYSLVFGILRLINFSHGSVYTFGAHMVAMYVAAEFGIVFGLLCGILTTAVLGVSIDKIALEPLRKKNAIPIASLITTIGVSYVISNMLMVIFGSEKKRFPAFYSFGSFKIGENINITSSQIVMAATSLILMVVLTIVVNKTRIGLAMRATEQNRRAAHLMGVNVNFVISFTFFLGAASAAIAGALVGGYYEIYYPTMGVIIGLKAFAAAVLGGIGSLYGSVIGGLAVGVIESLAATVLGSTYRDAIAFVLLILVLTIRPIGFFGKKEITKV